MTHSSKTTFAAVMIILISIDMLILFVVDTPAFMSLTHFIVFSLTVGLYFYLKSNQSKSFNIPTMNPNSEPPNVYTINPVIYNLLSNYLSNFLIQSGQVNTETLDKLHHLITRHIDLFNTDFFAIQGKISYQHDLLHKLNERYSDEPPPQESKSCDTPASTQLNFEHYAKEVKKILNEVDDAITTMHKEHGDIGEQITDIIAEIDQNLSSTNIASMLNLSSDTDEKEASKIRHKLNHIQASLSESRQLYRSMNNTQTEALGSLNQLNTLLFSLQDMDKLFHQNVNGLKQKSSEIQQSTAMIIQSLQIGDMLSQYLVYLKDDLKLINTSFQSLSEQYTETENTDREIFFTNKINQLDNYIQQLKTRISSHPVTQTSVQPGDIELF